MLHFLHIFCFFFCFSCTQNVTFSEQCCVILSKNVSRTHVLCKCFCWFLSKNMYGKRKKSQSIYFVKLSGLAFQENATFPVHFLDSFCSVPKMQENVTFSVHILGAFENSTQRCQKYLWVQDKCNIFLKRWR